ncbi:MAG: Isopentenyl-diphosphate delta-isomerase [Patescibacteria group bacterium]|nr:Isopentenyl-diphosphate delta-isomerase [Patescibacteria group bacterium]
MKQRKIDHIKLSLDDDSQAPVGPFDKYRLEYRALPEINLDDVSTEVSLLGKTISQPLIIASMTGGTKYAATINKNLAIAAEKTNVAIGVGSQRIALRDKSAVKTFELVREYAPSTVVFANMGAIQLNNNKTVRDYQAVVDMIGADALYRHINPLQEALQPSGDTNYADLLSKIATLVSKLRVPVYVKEVGNGIDSISAKMLIQAGVSGIDVAGVGGTSYSWIEGKRAKSANLAEWFKSAGVETDQSIMEISNIKKNVSLVASGGIRTPLDGLKAHALGADYYSMARPLLQKAIVSSEETILFLEEFQRGLQVALFSCGSGDWDSGKSIKLTK